LYLLNRQRKGKNNLDEPLYTQRAKKAMGKTIRFLIIPSKKRASDNESGHEKRLIPIQNLKRLLSDSF